MSSIIRISTLVLLFAIQTTVLAEDAVRWAPNLDTAKRVAASKNQLVLIHFYADNCPPCRRLEANVFSQPSFANDVEQNYVPVKINASSEPHVAKEFGVDRWPQDVVIAPSGQVLYRMISPQDQNRYVGILAQVSSKMNPNANPASPGGSMVAQAANTTPVAPQAPQQVAPGPPQGSRYSSFTSNAAPSAAPPAQPQTQQPAAPQAPASRFATYGPSSDQTAPSQAPAQSRFGSAAPQQNTAPAQPSVQQFAGQSQPAQSNVAPQQSTQPRPEASQPEQPQFAMDGYCPVTLVEQMKWQKGDPRWGARHQGQVYLFSSQAEQQKFLANPNQFSPVMSGIDPVAFLGKGQVVPGDRRFGLTYRGTLYLFSSEESLQTFWNEPQRYSSMVQQAMASQNMRR